MHYLAYVHFILGVRYSVNSFIFNNMKNFYFIFMATAYRGVRISILQNASIIYNSSEKIQSYTTSKTYKRIESRRYRRITKLLEELRTISDVCCRT